MSAPTPAARRPALRVLSEPPAAPAADHAPPQTPSLRRADVPDALWNDWRWQLQHRVTTLAELERYLELSPAERSGMIAAPSEFRVGITPYYLSLMDPLHPFCPVRMQVVPTAAELTHSAGEYRDPLGEDDLSPATGLVHRYPDRVLLLCLDRCGHRAEQYTCRQSGLHVDVRSHVDILLAS
mgnify:CR=1 FL=1